LAEVPGAKIDGERRLLSKKGNHAACQIAFYWSLFPVIGKQVGKEIGGVESGTRNVLCAWILAALYKSYL
jgi:hypothetical protein